jgi:hypothetical protein
MFIVQQEIAVTSITAFVRLKLCLGYNGTSKQNTVYRSWKHVFGVYSPYEDLETDVKIDCTVQKYV